MYNEQIEALISAALADGALTEKEKQILFKKAQSMGIDLDEFEMVLDARLVELKKAEKEKAEKSAPKSTKYGDVRKCPVCGALVPALAGVCPECGYEFSGIDANLTFKELAEKLDKEANKWDEKIANVNGDKFDDDDKKWQFAKDKEQMMAQVIKSYSIPNTKVDLFEFISMAQTNFLSSTTNYYLAESYFAKYNEALNKARHLFANDKMFEKLFLEHTDYEKQYNITHKKHPKVGWLKPSVKAMVILFGGGLLMLFILAVLSELL